MKYKYIIAFVFFLLFVTLAVPAQVSNSVLVQGRVQWKYAGIAGYPGKLKAEAQSKEVYTATIDSTGSYRLRLPYGRYTLSAATHYHWNNEDYIRIRDTTSFIVIDLKSAAPFNAPVLELDTIALTIPFPPVGIARHFRQRDAARIDDFIRKQMTHFEIPGASLAIIKGGKIIYSQIYGEKNAVAGLPVSRHTLFEAGSVTKTVFAFVVMRLVEKGILSLDEPLWELVPFPEISLDNRYKLITARHVLSHQTGLPNWGRPDNTGHFQLLFTPGTKFGYSGEGFEYLKKVVEHLTAKTIDQLLQEEFLLPLHLSGFYFRGSDTINTFAANGHIDLKPSPIRFIEKPMMAFSLVTEARAFSQFILAMRNKQGLKPSTYAELLKIHSTREPGVHWGLGFELDSTASGLSYGHSGSTSSGFICNFSFFPELDLGYVFFTNSDIGATLAIPLLTRLLVTGKE